MASSKNGQVYFTIKDYKQKLEYLAKKTNLLEPETVKEFLAKSHMSETSKHNYATVLKGFYDHFGIIWSNQNMKCHVKFPLSRLSRSLTY